MTDIAIPEDTKKSRIARVARTIEPALDDVATAGDRIKAFWKKHPDGSILTTVSHRISGETTVYTVEAHVRKDNESENPDATANATRSDSDPDPVTAMFPQETAETSAVSRALRNLGIIPTPSKPRSPRQTKDEA